MPDVQSVSLRTLRKDLSLCGSFLCSSGLSSLCSLFLCLGGSGSSLLVSHLLGDFLIHFLLGIESLVSAFQASNFFCAAASSKAPFFTPPFRCFIR